MTDEASKAGGEPPEGQWRRRCEQLSEHADVLQAKNHALAQALNRAGRELRQAKSQLVNLAQPPENFAVFVRVDSSHVDDDGVRHAAAEVVMGSRRMVVPVSDLVNVDRLSCGQTVLLNENMVIVATRDLPLGGTVRQVEETLPGGRLMVVDQSGRIDVAIRSGALANTEFDHGDRVLLDASGTIALETLPRQDEGDLVLEEVPDVSFDDIGGLDAQIDQIRDAVELPFLHRDLFERYDLTPPRGVLLYGPPGNGKTLIAKAVANSLAKGSGDESGVFLSVKGPEILSKFVGESERIIRSIFDRARRRAADGSPVIVFIDEMDSLLRTRGSGVSSDVETTIVPQFLSELDGIETLRNVMVIGASNRIDMIDPAVLRPGRLDVKIRIDRPGRSQAASILRHYLTDDLPLADGATADDLVAVTAGDIFRRDASRHVCDIADESGQWTSVYFADLISGAMLKNIVDRAKTAAVKASITQGREARLDAASLGAAIGEEYRECVDSISGVNPRQWVTLNGIDVNRATAVVPATDQARRI
ncbi:proteasome ATPase [Bifidobacterium sp. 82T24]|uniref:proteasome ATPase n=1 Tax=Bifidobacterium pluvialisilvae TaxID=2834436 RepID=UPI001C5721DF|nr:proteasome ATPase [Bifidobacterium pluvialisilvae]MBW3087138.1 proteasome ATPase [Bifidobacterium pluvialisilvae]